MKKKLSFKIWICFDYIQYAPILHHVHEPNSILQYKHQIIFESKLLIKIEYIQKCEIKAMTTIVVNKTIK